MTTADYHDNDYWHATPTIASCCCESVLGIQCAGPDHRPVNGPVEGKHWCLNCPTHGLEPRRPATNKPKPPQPDPGDPYGDPVWGETMRRFDAWWERRFGRRRRHDYRGPA